MKKISIIYFIIIVLALSIQSCSFDDDVIKYEQKVVVFASINAGFPVIDTVFVSRSASVEEEIMADDLWIDSASVKLIRESDSSELIFYPQGNGRYFPISMDNVLSQDSIYLHWANYIITSGTSYRLAVIHDEDSVIAITNVPEKIEISPIDMDDWQCPDGSFDSSKVVDVNNLNNMSFEQMISLYQDPINYITANSVDVDSVIFKIGDCFTKSFASAPLFGVNYNEDEYNTIQIISNALEANVIDLEPYTDENEDGEYNNNEPFSDRNRNGVRDSCYINLIYSDEKGLFDDDSLDYNRIANIWKQPLKRGSSNDGTWRDNSPYRNNPWLWNVDISPTNIMWLYFDYYGYYMMTFKSTSDSYFNYFRGDPVGQNIYLLPSSNFENGLGVFYSSSSASFLVKILRQSNL